MLSWEAEAAGERETEAGKPGAICTAAPPHPAGLSRYFMFS